MTFVTKIHRPWGRAVLVDILQVYIWWDHATKQKGSPINTYQLECPVGLHLKLAKRALKAPPGSLYNEPALR